MHAKSPAPNTRPAEAQAEPSGPRQSGQPQTAERRFFSAEHAVVAGNAPTADFQSYPTPASPTPPIYYDFQPASTKSPDTIIYHDSLALPDSFDPAYALPPVLPTTAVPSSQRYQSYPASPLVTVAPPVTTSRPIYREHTETFRPAQVLVEKQVKKKKETDLATTSTNQ